MTRALAALLGLAVAWGAWGEYRIVRMERDHADKVQQAATDHAEALAKQRKEDQDVRNRQAKALDAAHLETQRWQADALRAERAGAGLRAEADSLRQRLAATGGPAAGSCAPATEAAGVLADLLLECSERRRTVSRYADAAGTAAAACAAHADARSQRPEGVADPTP